MTDGPRLMTVGTINSGTTPIQADVTFLEPGSAVSVTLLVDYEQLCPPGWPSRPGETGARAEDLNFPRTLRSGSTLSLLKPEADALVAAGAGAPV